MRFRSLADPPGWRIFLGFLLAPAMAALLLALFEPAYDGLSNPLERFWRTAVVYATVGAYPTAVVFGVPAFAILRYRVAASWPNCSVAGALVAAFPWMLLVFLGSNPDQASIGGKATVIDGTTTAYGWLLKAEFVGMIGLFGAFAGLVFWATAALSLRPALVRGNGS